MYILSSYKLFDDVVGNMTIHIHQSDTLVTGSEVTAISTEFKDTTAYSLGLGRKLNDNWSISASYSEEKGGVSTSGSLFTVSNGTKALKLGARYTRGDMTITGGVNMTEVGGVTIKSDAGTELANTTPIV